LARSDASESVRPVAQFGSVPTETTDESIDNRLTPLDSHRSLVEDAMERLRHAVLSGQFRQGERLIETKVAQQLQVSRGTVREAFKLLRSEGLVEEEPRRGTFVVSLSGHDASEIYELRAAIEGRAASVIARWGEADAIKELDELCTRMENAEAAGDHADVYAGDLAFHDALCRLSGNARLHEVFLRYVSALRALLQLDTRIYGPLENVVGGHRVLLNAIRSGDADAARRLAEQHCDQAGHHASQYLKSLEHE
jgi:GntR family transcriptional regulator, gluconate operon transcriptional repressor